MICPECKTLTESIHCPNCSSLTDNQNSANNSDDSININDVPDTQWNNQRGVSLGEGSFGHSDPSWRRDESFASVIPSHRHANWMRHSDMEATDAEFPFHIEQIIQPGPRTVEVDVGAEQPLVLQNKDQDVLDQARSDLINKRSGLFSTLGAGLGGLIGSVIGPEGTAAGAEIGGALGTGASVVNAAHTIGGLMGHVLGSGGSKSSPGTGAQGPIPSDTMGLIQQPGQSVSAGLSRMAKIVMGEDYDSPNSVSIIPQKEDTGDPEDVDPHELNDGTHDTWQKENDIDGIGGSQEDTYAGFDPLQSHSIKVLEMNLPLVRHYHEQGEGSGADDPLMQALDSLLEGELPGYKDHPENADQDLLQAILNFGLDDDNEDPTSLPKDEEEEEKGPLKDEAGDRGSDDDWDDNDMEKESSIKCPSCKTASTFPLDMCPGCGYEKIAGGPENPEQFQAVKALLEAQGRQDEIPMLIDDPDAYTKELLEIQHQQQIDPGDSQPTAQEGPMPEEPGDQPGAGMPMPPPPTGQQPMASVQAGLAHVNCPKCNSHTTTVLDTESGYSQCHTCGHRFDTDLEPSDGHSTHHDVTAAADDNPSILDAADQDSPDIPHGNAATLTWQDTEGNPLEVGQTYLVYSPKYKIPDRQTITGVKPNSYTYEQTGEYGIGHSNEISKQEANMDGLQFVPDHTEDVGNEEIGPAAGIEENNDYAGQSADPNQQTDMSNSQEYRQSSYDPNFQPSASWLMQDDMTHTAGKNYTSWEQRELIMEPGTARNLDKLDLSNSHYDPNWDRDEEFLW